MQINLLKIESRSSLCCCHCCFVVDVVAAITLGVVVKAHKLGSDHFPEDENILSCSPYLAWLSFIPSTRRKLGSGSGTHMAEQRWWPVVVVWNAEKN